MTQRLSSRFIPVALCVFAALALTAAGFLLFDSGDQQSPEPSADQGSFASYQAEASDEADDEPEETEESKDSADPVEAAEEIELVEETMDYGHDPGPESLEELDEEREQDEQKQEEREEKEALRDVEKQQDDQIVERTAASPASTGRSGRLVVVTNFTRAEVTVNGERYPAYSDDGHNRGMELPSNQVHEVFVRFDENTRVYDIELRPGERRLLMVELTGLNQSAPDRQRTERPEAPARRERARRAPDEDELEDDEGRITIYSRPRGTVFMAGEETEHGTPATVEVDPGRHEVRVQYDDGEMSETKTVRVREGSRVQLFFRQED